MLLEILKFSKKAIVKIAQCTNSIAREQKVLSVDLLLEAICLTSINKNHSLKDTCVYLETNHKISITKQAISERLLKDGTVDFFYEIAKKTIIEKISANEMNLKKFKKKYLRILVQDSTIIEIPPSLYKHFSGSKNKTKTTASVRVQFIYDILNKNFIHFSIDSYSQNDQSVASDIEVRKGDLWLRDRGYFSFDAFTKIINNGGHVITRYLPNVKIYDYYTKDEICLEKILKNNKKINRKVFVGEEKLVMQLVINPVEKKIKCERIKKAKRHSRAKKVNGKLSKKYSFLCGFTIYLTTIDIKLTFKEIFKIYALRWRIEIIFKTWKSHMNFDNMHKMSKNRLIILLIARLIMVDIIFSKIYNTYFEYVHEKYGKILSIISLTKFICQDIRHFLVRLTNNEFKELGKLFSKYCTYEKRKDRENYCEMEEAAFIILNKFAKN